MKFIQRYDIVSGSRYLKNSKIKSPAPEKRRYVNLIITKIINRITNYNLTDSFCGFKGYKVESLRKIRLSSKGLAAPLELLLKAYQYGLLIREIPVSLIYFKSRRDFQGKMSNMNYRINYYKKTIIT